MQCQITRNELAKGFTLSDLKSIFDPYTQESLYDLCQRAFKVGMPYFAFAVADLGSPHFACYDAIYYRLGILNNCKMDKDPNTRRAIKKVEYFAIERPKDLNSIDKLRAHSFPPPHYFHDSNFTKEHIEKYAFSGLNYFVAEEGKQDEIDHLKQIHTFLQLYFQIQSLQTNDQYKLEEKKWSQITLNKSPQEVYNLGRTHEYLK